MGNLDSFNISWNEVEITDFKPLPAGNYAAKVIKSEIADTKKKDKMLKLTFELLGENKGRKIFESYMLQHSNPQAVKMGLGKIKSLAGCLGIDFDNLQDTSELHGKPVGIKVKVIESEEYGDKNGITSFMEYDESMLSSDSQGESIQVDAVSVDEPEVVEDDVEEEEVSEEPAATPQFVRGLKKKDFLLFVKGQGIDLKLTKEDGSGKKLSELKEEVVDKLFGTEVVEDEDDIIIEG